jgi:hypothetical protein
MFFFTFAFSDRDIDMEFLRLVWLRAAGGWMEPWKGQATGRLDERNRLR